MAPGSGAPSGGDLAGLGVFLAVAVIVPLILGTVLDRALGTGPLFLLVGLVVGIAAAVAVVYTRYVKRFL
ncbi:MAG: AtpZ/AtpI family protein [Candidatus Dormibacteraeota bacterium]|nr:AtpZ/AtpI family protein [Candidatus Dormibacteraeota bacterium]MBO0704046.1 AtpZ/AtpI family protein [Candidatus Dormibacteraeota bacterium]MBO0760161.1 AtpZ/AtpI family protein [Candidatus Dormibacteraeota bacterium]